MIKKLILGIFTIILFINFETAYSEIFIKAKVNNQIITNFDGSVIRFKQGAINTGASSSTNKVGQMAKRATDLTDLA